MLTAKIFENGRSQAVRLPKEYRFNTDEISINKVGDIVMLIPKNKKWESFAKAIDMFSSDYMEDGRNDCVNQKREGL
ncbi:MAG: type II toxin-antitoxin system VapB family antitoxin [Erysipelotrichaceae bacterium]|nr:type II toxin-antitoxin system VapB family antitoxin [Erysipelotrichaceae bacterium]